LLRDTDDSNNLVLLVEADDIQKAKEFTASPDLRETMQKGRAIDKPDIYFLS
jgi:hypothetical protein